MHDDKLHMKMCDQAVVYKGRSPYVGADGYWYVWDDTTQAFKKTTTLARGPQGEQGEHGPQGEAGSGGASTWDAVSGKPSTFPPSAHSHAWTDITNKPDSYTPASHTHEVSDVNGLSSALGNKVDKVTGKGLSTNDYTDADKAKVGEISQIKEDIGALSDLTTTDKTSLVSAINEVAASGGGGGGTGGTTNYNALSNRPQINGTTLTGNKTAAELSLACASHTHTATQVTGLATVATSGSYNDLLNKPSIPAATTVTQTLTSGTEIGAVNGTKLYAPAGGGSGGWTKVFDHTVTEDEAASLTYISVPLTGNEKGILFLYAQTAGTVTTNGVAGVSGNAKSPWSDAGAKQITSNIQGITSGHKIQLGAFDIVENVLYPRQAFMSSNTEASSNVAGIWSYGLKFCVQQDTDYVPFEVTPQNRMYFNIGTYNTGWFGSGARLVVLTK